MLDQHVAQQRQITAATSNADESAWGTVLTVNAGLVTVELDDDPGRSYGAPTGLRCLHATGTLAVGWRAFLHFDTTGEPAYVAAWPT